MGVSLEPCPHYTLFTAGRQNTGKILMSTMLLLYFFLLAVVSSRPGGTIGENVDGVIDELGRKIADSQILKPTKYLPPLSFAKQFGVYPCDIRANFHGAPEFSLLRDAFACFDNNAFVTLWVSSILLEATKFWKGPLPTDNQLYFALEAISEYHDKNYDMDEGILVFWLQTYNETDEKWSCEPENIGNIVHDGEEVLEELHKLLDDLGLVRLWDKIAPLAQQLIISLDAFKIPADFDDTFVNIGFGSLLAKYSVISSGPYQAWRSKNSKFVQAFEALKLYAYRPFSGNIDSDLIDPRTFYYLREYLYSVQDNNQPAAFVVTWVQNMTEDRVNFKKNYRMPFNVNNIDLTVATNTIYGISAAVLSNLTNNSQWFDPELQMIYENTTDLIAWCIEKNFSGRPDLALTYYPSVFNFYWFTARILNLLTSASSLPFPVMERVKMRLSDCLRGHATTSLLNMVTLDGELAYFDDFLGDADTNILGLHVNHGEDRICSTAMAINALLYVWMGSEEKLLPNTPATVKNVVVRASEWLIQNTLTGHYKRYSAVFSGSVKSIENLPFYYPTNIVQYINGSAIPANASASPEMVFGVRGIIPQKEYKKQLLQKHFGRLTPIDFKGYNTPDFNGWPFWSSEPFTYASAMLALTQYRALLASGQLS